jgi:N-acetylglutamate synthase-like GNAT family acetyltransferase
MSNSKTRAYPRALASAAGEIQVRYMEPKDEEAILAFAAVLPPHDLLFLRRDISHRKVVAAWMRDLEAGARGSLIALLNREVVGCAAIIRDELSWSKHVAELRVLTSVGLRGKGLGQFLIQESFAVALALEVEKLVVQMTVDQGSGIAIFEGLGFTAEALLREHVKDREGNKHDVVILSLAVDESRADLDLYGLTNALADTEARQ